MTVIKQLLQNFQTKQAHVGILGLGYVGLPLAVIFAEAGFEVVGVEPIQSKVDAINRGESYIMDVPTQKVADLVKAGKLKATTDFNICATLDAVSICVPTPLRKTGDPDLSFIISATEGLAPNIHYPLWYGCGARIFNLSWNNSRNGRTKAGRD